MYERLGITNVWVQSAYRSIESQSRIYNREMQKHINQGKTEEVARRLTEEVIMIPGCSDHNLGLAVDFNDAETTFEDTKAFTWLKQNAENYGFVMRYPKDKEDITKITYEPWHWRYVGKDNAIEMNRLNMCLEEYVEYLNK
ncbi:MAG: M15 family metallopeptidase [Clostridia bacterium]|nr:M15 family metallopeptidase [Clostridia bacterium]